MKNVEEAKQVVRENPILLDPIIDNALDLAIAAAREGGQWEILRRSELYRSLLRDIRMGGDASAGAPKPPAVAPTVQAHEAELETELEALVREATNEGRLRRVSANPTLLVAGQQWLDTMIEDARRKGDSNRLLRLLRQQCALFISSGRQEGGAVDALSTPLLIKELLDAVAKTDWISSVELSCRALLREEYAAIRATRTAGPLLWTTGTTGVLHSKVMLGTSEGRLHS